MKLTIHGPRATFTGRLTPQVLLTVHRLEGGVQWIDGGNSFWLEASERNIETMRRELRGLAIERAVPEAHGAGQPLAFGSDATPAAYTPRTQPLPHQLAALAKMRQHPAFALFMEQGTGKTWVAITRAGELWAQGKISAVLVVSRKGVHRQWVVEQLPEHFGGPYDAAYWEGGRWVSPRQPDQDGLVWRTINFDGAKTDKGRKACLAFLKAHRGRVMIIADETQDIKNYRSQRHKAMVELRRAAGSPYRLALTGTPIAKDLTDEWAQLRWLDESIIGISYVTAFRAEYCVMGGFEGRVVIGHKNLDRFKRLADPYIFRALKDDLGILPKAYRRWKIELSHEQRAVIAGLRSELRHELDCGATVTSMTVAGSLAKIQQAASGFAVDEEGRVIELVPPERNPRIKALLEILAACEGPTIVWTRFRHDFGVLERALTAQGITVARYHGAVTDRDRAEAVRRFMAGEARVFLANQQVGGTGLNLQGECRHAIYYHNTFNAIDRWQSEDRIHRIGTRGQVVYTDIVARGTLDAAILANLRQKKGLSDLALSELKEALDHDW